MEIVFYIFVGVGLIYYLWLSVLASIAVRYDSTMNTFQKNAQTVFLWLIPIFGSSFVLHLVWEHYPDAIPDSWIPWPFKKIIFGKEPPNNKNRDDDDSAAINGSINQHNHSGTDYGGDDGGD